MLQGKCIYYDEVMKNIVSYLPNVSNQVTVLIYELMNGFGLT